MHFHIWGVINPVLWLLDEEAAAQAVGIGGAVALLAFVAFGIYKLVT